MTGVKAGQVFYAVDGQGFTLSRETLDEAVETYRDEILRGQDYTYMKIFRVVADENMSWDDAADYAAAGGYNDDTVEVRPPFRVVT